MKVLHVEVKLFGSIGDFLELSTGKTRSARVTGFVLGESNGCLEGVVDLSETYQRELAIRILLLRKGIMSCISFNTTGLAVGLCS